MKKMNLLKLSLVVAVSVTVFVGCSDSSDENPNPGPEASGETNSQNILVDDFENASENNIGMGRVFLDDSSAGGKTKTQHQVEGGMLHMKGALIPARGQPGWATIVLPLEAEGYGRDLSDYQGVRILVKVNQGNLSVSVNSTDITNFDYHSSMVTPKLDGEFHEVHLPFNKMNRTWSAPTKLNTESIQSLSLVAFDVQQGSFHFEIDEVSFY